MIPARAATLLALQVVAPTLKLAVGVVALRMVPRLAEPRTSANGASWWITGVVMTYIGVNNLVQSLAAAGAYAAGAGSAFYAGYLRLVPAGNQSRTFAVMGMGLLLTSVALGSARRDTHLRAVALGVMVLATVAGAAVGWSEGGMTEAHYLDKAFFDLFELFSLFFALGLGLWRDSMDRLLWECLAVYAFYSALNVLWFSSMSWLAVAGAWSPDPVYTQVYATAIHTVMLAIALERLKRAQAGTPVQSMLDSLGPRRTSTSLP
jgi:hypothetical protein